MNTAVRDSVAQAILQATGERFGNFTYHAIGGGCINQTYELRQGAQSYFLKLNSASLLPMFEAEYEALQTIFGTNTIRVPKPIALGTVEGSSFLVLEYCAPGKGNADTARRLGEQLAALHRCTSPDGRFGWLHDNFIGSTSQPNAWHDRWIDFWREERLGHQLRLAAADGHRFKNADRLVEGMEVLFGNYQPAPSLLHGDLWTGNVGVTDAETPFIYDPASYYGDRETDLSMTRLFGSLPPAFYQAYEEAYPLASGHETRRELYNLYHILNHAHLFGGHYAAQAQRVIDGLVARI
jgi:fructosamine-3-kinase